MIYDELTEAKLRRVMQLIQPHRQLVFANYGDRAPVGNFTEEERLEFIIASVPCASSLPSIHIVDQLKRKKTKWWKYDNEPTNRAETIHEWAKKFPETAFELAAFMRGYKSAPERLKRNTEWMCILALDDVVDWAQSIYQWPDSGVVTAEQLNEFMVGFIDGFKER